MKTFTGSFRHGAAYDETPYARLVARHAQCEYLECWPTWQDFRDTLPRIIALMDEPSAGPGVFPQYMVSSLASKHVKVVLGGQGGDEIFADMPVISLDTWRSALKGAIEETENTVRYAATLLPSSPTFPCCVNMWLGWWDKVLLPLQLYQFTTNKILSSI